MAVLLTPQPIANVASMSPLGRIHFDNLAAIGAIAWGLLKGPKWIAVAGGAYLAYTQRNWIASLFQNR